MKCGNIHLWSTTTRKWIISSAASWIELGGHCPKYHVGTNQIPHDLMRGAKCDKHKMANTHGGEESMAGAETNRATMLPPVMGIIHSQTRITPGEKPTRTPYLVVWVPPSTAFQLGCSGCRSGTHLRAVFAPNRLQRWENPLFSSKLPLKSAGCCLCSCLCPAARGIGRQAYSWAVWWVNARASRLLCLPKQVIRAPPRLAAALQLDPDRCALAKSRGRRTLRASEIYLLVRRFRPVAWVGSDFPGASSVTPWTRKGNSLTLRFPGVRQYCSLASRTMCCTHSCTCYPALPSEMNPVPS